MRSRVLPTLILAIGIAAAGYFIRTGIVASKQFGQVISVRGLAERVVESNEASWNATFSLTDMDLLRLNRRLKESQEIFEGFLKERGFSGAEVQKIAVQITDRMAERYGENNRNKDRYVATGGFLVSSKKVKDLAAASVQTEELIKKGVVLTASTLTYYFTDLNAIKPQMLKEAIASAQEAAQGFAQNSQAEIGPIRNASQGLFSIGSLHDDYDSKNSILKKVRVVTNVDFFLR